MSHQCLQAISRRRQEDFGQEPEEESSFNHPVFTRIFDDTRLRDDDDVAATAEVRRWSWPAMSVDGGPGFESSPDFTELKK